MIISIILSWLIAHFTDGRIDELFRPGGSTNITARYTIGGLIVWGVFAGLVHDLPEPWRTRARKDIGIAFLLVGLGVSGRRIYEACK